MGKVRTRAQPKPVKARGKRTRKPAPAKIKTTAKPVKAAPTVSSGASSGNKGRKGRIENLKPWPKGTSGNPDGRPRKPLTLLSNAYGEILKRPMPPDMFKELLAAVAEGATVAEVIALTIAQHASRGDVQSAREIRVATEGERQTHEFIDPSEARNEIARRIAELAERRRPSEAAEQPE